MPKGKNEVRPEGIMPLQVQSRREFDRIKGRQDQRVWH